jgi:hypothetical protein
LLAATVPTWQACPLTSPAAVFLQLAADAAAVRRLLGTWTITASQGDLWSAQTKVQTQRSTTVNPGDNTVTRQTAQASGTAFASNQLRCLTATDCTAPVARVDTSVDSTNTAHATSTAQGDVFSSAKASAVHTCLTRGDLVMMGHHVSHSHCIANLPADKDDICINNDQQPCRHRFNRDRAVIRLFPADPQQSGQHGGYQRSGPHGRFWDNWCGDGGDGRQR